MVGRLDRTSESSMVNIASYPGRPLADVDPLPEIIKREEGLVKLITGRKDLIAAWAQI